MTFICFLNLYVNLVYIHLPHEIKERSASLLFITNSVGDYRWHIRATQIHCVPDHIESSRQMRAMFPFAPRAEYKSTLPAPQGCLQYFPAQTGIIESFNFGEYLNGLDYAICIERHTDTCKVTFTVLDYDWSLSRADLRSKTSARGDDICSGDYLMIPGGSQFGEDFTSDRFCGAYLSFLKEGKENLPVVSKANGPILLRFHSDYYHDPKLKSGFRLRYEQSDINCQANYPTEEPDLLPNVPILNPINTAVDTSSMNIPPFYSRSKFKAKIDEDLSTSMFVKSARMNAKILKF